MSLALGAPSSSPSPDVEKRTLAASLGRPPTIRVLTGARPRAVRALPVDPAPHQPVHRGLAGDHRHGLPGRGRHHRRAGDGRRLHVAAARPAVGVDARRLPLQEESIIYDRTGKIELARFGDSKRDIVDYEDIPPILLDATTAVEDKTFWENAGFDPVAIISAALDSLRGNSRGASTITQQLVRARLLDEKLVQDPNRTAERKLKEIIQSIRLTSAYPGEEGKQKIITAYLNQNYYGNQAYGVKAAVKEYFGIPLDS